jgi:hypothetical protein
VDASDESVVVSGIIIILISFWFIPFSIFSIFLYHNYGITCMYSNRYLRYFRV